MMYKSLYNYYILLNFFFYQLYIKFLLLFYNQSSNNDFININDLYGKFYIINKNNNIQYIQFDINIYNQQKMYIHLNNVYKSKQYNCIYKQFDNNHIRSNFLLNNKYHIITSYIHIIDIQKYNPYGIYLYIYVINGIFINKYLCFKPNNISMNSNRYTSKLYQSKYYAKCNLYNKYKGLSELYIDEKYIQLFSQ